MTAIIIGRRRQGKSTLALHLALRLHRTVLVYDPNEQYQRLPVVSDPETLRLWLEVERIGVIRYRPSPGQLEEDFTALAGVVWPWGNYSLVVDEASCLQRAGGTNPALERIIRQAPREKSRNDAGLIVDVALIQTAHRISDFSTVCRALATDVFIFQTSLQRDLETIEDQYGAEVRSIVPRLPRFHVVHIWQDLDGRQKFSVWRDPAIWYVDTKAPGRGEDHGGSIITATESRAA